MKRGYDARSGARGNGQELDVPRRGDDLLVGQDMIRDLRREMAARAGSAFNLRRFHDHFSYGSIPVAMIAGDAR